MNEHNQPTKELFFIRHGQTEWNAIRRMQGQWNSDLNDIGRQQAHINGQFLKQFNLQKLHVSPLDRTTQTATIINEYVDTEMEFHDALKEWHCGDWSGEMWDQVGTRWPTEFEAWQNDQFNYRGPNCENYPDMIERVTPFLDSLASSPLDRIGIVSHGMIGRVMVGCLLEHTPEQMLAFQQSNDTIFHLTMRNSGIAVQHFIGGDGPFEGLPERL